MCVEPVAVHKRVCKNRHKLIFALGERKRIGRINCRKIAVKKLMSLPVYCYSAICEVHHAEKVTVR